MNARNRKKVGSNETVYLEQANDHSRVVYEVTSFPPPFSSRYFVSQNMWSLLDKDRVVITTTPTNLPNHPSNPNHLRGYKTHYLRIKSLGSDSNLCELETVATFLDEVNLPKFATLSILKTIVRPVTIAQQYFQQLRELRDFDEGDGNGLGWAFIEKHHFDEAVKKNLALKRQVNRVCENHVGMKEFVLHNVWFPSLVEGMLNNALANVKGLNTRLDLLSNREASKIGGAFSLALLDRLQAQSGTDLWINDFRALTELHVRHSFFAPMAAVIGQWKLNQATWGRLAQTALGTCFSILDVGTDISAVITFMRDGQKQFAFAILGVTGASMAIQLLIACVNVKRRGVKYMALEFLLILVGVKPVVDAYRVISGHKKHALELFEPTILVFSNRAVEQ